MPEEKVINNSVYNKNLDEIIKIFFCESCNRVAGNIKEHNRAENRYNNFIQKQKKLLLI